MTTKLCNCFTKLYFFSDSHNFHKSFFFPTSHFCWIISACSNFVSAKLICKIPVINSCFFQYMYDKYMHAINWEFSSRMFFFLSLQRYSVMQWSVFFNESALDYILSLCSAYTLCFTWMIHVNI